MARALRQGRGHVIGVVVPRLHLTIFSEILQGIEEEAQKRGYMTTVCVTEDDPKIERDRLNRLRDGGTDGVIIAATGRNLVRGCGLFGCGVNAVYATSCQGLTVEDTEMYECSGEGAIIWDCYGVSFDNCSIHDCPSNSVNVYNSLNVTWNGQTLREGLNVF